MKEFLSNHKRVVCMAMSLLLMMSLAIPAFATGEGGGTAGINSAVTSALGTVQSDALSLIASVLPYALAIMGAIIVVMVGIRVFKRVAGK